MVGIIAGQFQLNMDDWNYVSFAPKYLTATPQGSGFAVQSTHDVYAYASLPKPNFGAIRMTIDGSDWGEVDAAGMPHTGLVQSATLMGSNYLSVAFYDLNMPIWQFIEIISSSDIKNIKNLLLGGDDRIVGTSDNDWAYDLGDRLYGGAGNDEIYGQGGNDTIDGGSGNDTISTVPVVSPNTNIVISNAAKIDGGSGIDTWTFALTKSGISVNLETGVSGADRAVNMENVTGSAYADQITGSSGVNWLDGADGDDTILGGAGDDHLIGGAGVNSLDGGDGNDILQGGAGGEQMDGGVGDDLIGGDGGNDFIRGGDGANLLLGDDGDDTIIGGSGQERIYGGSGADTMTGGAGFDDMNGNMGDDSLRGGDGDDWVVGGKDNDILYGEAGDDIVYGNLGNDQGYGDDGNDIVRGGQGDDTLFGGAGNDWMSGDRGLDNLSGGAGADVFNSFIGAGFDYVHDFSVTEGDRIRLEGVTSYQVVQVGSQTEIRFGDGDVLVLLNVQVSSLHSDSIFLA